MISLIGSWFTSRRSPLLLCFGLAALALFTVACSGGDDEAESSGATGAVTAAPTTVVPDFEAPVVASPTLRSGDCFNDAADLIAATNSIGCDTPHLFEVFSFTEIDSNEFPGSEEANALGASTCEAEFVEAESGVERQGGR